MQDDQLRAALKDCAGPPDQAAQQAISNARSISMLSREVLERLWLLASITRGPILEVGPYVGGSTTALCTGARQSGARVTSIEMGGSYPEHPMRPSSDILGDLHANLRRWGNESMVTVIEGFVQDYRVRHKARQVMGHNPATLLFVDADGDIARILFRYRRLIADDALLVLDDYATEGAPDKQERVRAFVDSMVLSDAFIQFGVFEGGTWFGRLNGGAGKRALERTALAFPREHGYCYTIASVFPVTASSLRHKDRSSLALFEDGDRLGPANSIHDDIRNLGAGRYSHWNGQPENEADSLEESTLYFSTSDNTDPNENGRRYTVAVGNHQVELVDI